MFDTLLWKLVICLSSLNAYHTSVTYFLWGHVSVVVVLLVIQRTSFWLKPQIKLKNCISDWIIIYLAARSISQNTVSTEGISVGKIQY
jgi:uncharacterized membrane protein YjfL (UPF0719 family)